MRPDLKLHSLQMEHACSTSDLSFRLVILIYTVPITYFTSFSFTYLNEVSIYFALAGHTELSFVAHRHSINRLSMRVYVLE